MQLCMGVSVAFRPNLSEFTYTFELKLSPEVILRRTFEIKTFCTVFILFIYVDQNGAILPVLIVSISLFADLLLIFYYWRAIGDKFFIIHHLAALYAYYYVLVSALLSNSRTCRQDGKDTTKGEQSY